MIYFLIPVFNEEKNIPLLFNELSSVLPDQEKFYIFSNDGSSDNTISCIQHYFQDVPYIILGDHKNRGPGYAFNVGFEWILNHSQSNDDVVITLEADTTSDISILPQMLAIHKQGYDLVLASVYAQGGGFDKTSFFRKIISFFANMMFRLFFNVKVLTLSSFYRIYSVALLKKVKSTYGTIVSEYGFICMLEVLLKCIRCEARIIEVPMVLKSSKRKGKSKMKVLKTFYGYLAFLIKYKLKN